MAIMPEGPIYLAECLWPNVTRDEVRSAARRALQATEQLAAAGSSIRFIGSILVPQDEVVFFQFEGGPAAEIARVCRSADVPFERVVSSEHFPA